MWWIKVSHNLSLRITFLGLFSSDAYFKVSQFWEVLIFELCLFSSQALLSRKYGNWILATSFQAASLFFRPLWRAEWAVCILNRQSGYEVTAGTKCLYRPVTFGLGAGLNSILYSLPMLNHELVQSRAEKRLAAEKVICCVATAYFPHTTLVSRISVHVRLI